MSILVDSDTRLIVQGITGREGSFSTRQIIDYGTNVVAGVSPGKGGEWIEGVPVFDTVKSAAEATGANTTLIYVPPQSAADSMFEAINSGIELIVCITEGIPIADMVEVYAYIKHANCILIGPNSPGVISPGQAVVGIIPGEIASSGSTGIVSKSGSLTYEVMYGLTQAGFGQSTCVGIGNDPIAGANFIDILELFEHDPETEWIVLIGEIGGQAENQAAEYIKRYMTKPIIAYIAGKSAPYGLIHGHQGAVIMTPQETVEAKISALQAAGVRIAEHPDQIVDLLRAL